MKFYLTYIASIIVCICSAQIKVSDPCNEPSQNPSFSLTLHACNNYTFNGITYTYPGTYLDTLQSISGCDSVVELNLSFTYAYVSAHFDGEIIHANSSCSQLQWFNCATGLPIIGETNTTYRPYRDGEYFVQVTNNDCTHRSACIFITSLGAASEIAQTPILYPNPNQGSIHFTESVAQVMIYSTDGKLLLIERDLNYLNTELPAGLYIVLFQDEAYNWHQNRLAVITE